MKTVKELADELGVPKHIVHNLVSSMNLRDKMTKSGNQFLLDESQILEIKKVLFAQNGRISSDERNDTTLSADEKTEQPTEVATENPDFLTLSERVDNRELRFNIIRLESELDKTRHEKFMLQKDFNAYKVQSERTLAAKTTEYEKTLNAKDEQLEQVTAALAGIAPYFGEQLEENEKPLKNSVIAKMLDKFRAVKSKSVNAG